MGWAEEGKEPLNITHADGKLLSMASEHR